MELLTNKALVFLNIHHIATPFNICWRLRFVSFQLIKLHNLFLDILICKPKILRTYILGRIFRKAKATVFQNKVFSNYLDTFVIKISPNQKDCLPSFVAIMNVESG